MFFVCFVALFIHPSKYLFIVVVCIIHACIILLTLTVVYIYTPVIDLRPVYTYISCGSFISAGCMMGIHADN